MARLDDLVEERDAIRARLVLLAQDPSTLAGAAESPAVGPATPNTVDSMRNRGAVLADLRRREQELQAEIERITTSQLDTQTVIAVRNNSETPRMPARWGSGSGSYNAQIKRARGF